MAGRVEGMRVPGNAVILGHKSQQELRGCAPGSSFSIWTLWLVILIRAAVCHWVMGLIRLEPSLEHGGDQNCSSVCPVLHPSPSMAQLP